MAEKETDKWWYYKITDKDTQQEFYASLNLPVKADKLLKVMGLEDVFLNSEVEQITKEEYENDD